MNEERLKAITLKLNKEDSTFVWDVVSANKKKDSAIRKYLDSMTTLARETYGRVLEESLSD